MTITQTSLMEDLSCWPEAGAPETFVEMPAHKRIEATVASVRLLNIFYPVIATNNNAPRCIARQVFW